MIDFINEKEIRRHLKVENLNFEIFDCVDSTNNIIKNRALSDCKEGLVVIASKQTNGRGRMGRYFSSPEGTGIYMSILLKPDIAPENSVLITTAAASAVATAIEDLSGKACEIKWVNDILMNSKKVCGILTEGVFPKSDSYFAVLGIGINVYKPQNDFEDEIKDIATFVFDEQLKGLKSQLIAKILNNFFEYYKNIEEKPFFNEYKKRCCCLGKDIDIFSNGKKVDEGKVIDLNQDLSLLIKCGEREKTLFSGEISIKTKTDNTICKE